MPEHPLASPLAVILPSAMVVASPLWLLTLVPWGAVVFWLLWGRRRRTAVSFIDLWRGPELRPPAKRTLHPPPLALGLVMAAMLLALLACSGPALTFAAARAAGPITVVVDRGLTMSAGSGGDRKFVLSGQSASDALSKAVDPQTPVELLLAPGVPRQTTVRGLVSTLQSLPGAAADTRSLLREAVVGAALANGSSPVVVLSDQSLGLNDPRIVQFAPPPRPDDNVAIVLLAARQTPRAQVMVRLANDSPRTSVGLTVTSGAEHVQQRVELPAAGQQRDYFIELPAVDSIVEASIDAQDEQTADNQAWLARESAAPRIEARTPLPDALRRMVDVYTRSEPPGEGSKTIAVVGREADLPQTGNAVWLGRGDGPVMTGPVTATADPITANVDPASIGPVIAAADPPAGWRPLLSLGGRPVAASRSDPTRAVWVGFTAPSWPATSDYVVFWANVFAWLGEGERRYVDHALIDLPPRATAIDLSPASSGGAPRLTEPWPGLYRGEDGVVRAYNCPRVPKGTAASTIDSTRRLNNLLKNASSTRRIDGWLLTAAALLILASAMTWKSHRLTPVLLGRTF